MSSTTTMTMTSTHSQRPGNRFKWNLSRKKQFNVIRGAESDAGMGALMLASATSEADLAVLLENGVTHILQVGIELVPSHPLSGFVYEHISLEDVPSANIRQHLPKALDFIEGSRRAGGNVLVHCAAGVSRSASVVIAYLMVKEHLSAADANASVLAIRSCIYPNDGFYQQLEALEAESPESRATWFPLQRGGEGLDTACLLALEEPASRRLAGASARADDASAGLYGQLEKLEAGACCHLQDLEVESTEETAAFCCLQRHIEGPATSSAPACTPTTRVPAGINGQGNQDSSVAVLMDQDLDLGSRPQPCGHPHGDLASTPCLQPPEELPLGSPWVPSEPSGSSRAPPQLWGCKQGQADSKDGACQSTFVDNGKSGQAGGLRGDPHPGVDGSGGCHPVFSTVCTVFGAFKNLVKRRPVCVVLSVAMCGALLLVHAPHSRRR